MRYLILLTSLLFPTALVAQSAPTIEVFGRAGFVTLWDDEGNLGTGPSLGAGAGIRLPIGVGIEALVERHSNDRNFASGVSFSSKATLFKGRLAKYFGTGPRQFYAGGSAGTSRITTRSQFPGLSQAERTTIAGSIGGFAGVRLAMGARGFARPEVELSRAGEHLRIAGSVAIGIGR